MKPLPIVTAVLLAVMPAVFGQGMRGGQGNSANEHLAKLHGRTASFTATEQISTQEKNGNTTVMEMAYALRDGMVRTETDLTKTQQKAKHGRGHGDDMSEMAGMGLDKQVTLVRPDKSVIYLIYPGLKAYSEMPMKKSAGDDKTAQGEWKELGKEKVDGHPCVKYLVTTTNADGSKDESTVWKATDLKDFIIQTVTQSGGDTVTVKFTNIKFDRPAAALFELPSDYKKYGSMQEMMMNSMQQMMKNMGGTSE